jgi:hypothetical protein
VPDVTEIDRAFDGLARAAMIGMPDRVASLEEISRLEPSR